MPELIRKGNVFSYQYSDDELIAAWSEDAQGHRQAVERGDMCVVFACTREQALLATRAFVENVFAIPTCCHYDGETLSMYCGDAGVGGYENCKSSAKGIARMALGWPNRQVISQPRLTVRLESFPESNGKRNWTAMFVRVEKWGGLAGNCGGITISRGELWNRVAYEAERAKLLIGERDTEPYILDYGKDIETPDQWEGEVHGGRSVRPVGN